MQHKQASYITYVCIEYYVDVCVSAYYVAPANVLRILLSYVRARILFFTYGICILSLVVQYAYVLALVIVASMVEGLFPLHDARTVIINT